MLFGAAILSSTLLSLFSRLSSRAVSRQGRLHDLEGEVEWLRGTLERLGASLRDAPGRGVEWELDALRLRELREVAREAEDVVDEFEYEELRRQAEGSGGSEKGEGSGSSRPPPDRRTALFHNEMSRRIDGIRRRLDEISEDMGKLDLGEMLVAEQDPPESIERMAKGTGSFLADPDLFGRDEVKNKLMGLLLGTAEVGQSSSSSSPPPPPPPVDHSTSLSVLSIVGMAGLGKTTLSRWVYNSKEVQEHFHLRMWVWVAHDFDMKRVTKQILEHVADGLQNTDNLDLLQECLVERLKDKRFLLILDDVWEEDRTKWLEFSAPLAQGGRGSKVVVTTRSAKVADTVHSVKIELGGLLLADCLSIFRKHAFAYADSDKCSNLELIGEEIVRKLKGVPLAAATIGGLLRFESEQSVWRDVLQSELWELEEGEEGIFPALKVSYEYLPPHLKQCFLYCSVFIKGHGYDVLESVQHWMAQGHVRGQCGRPMEDVGRDYFNELVDRSLIQLVKDKYVIHDLLHDLGQLILKDDCYQIGPGRVQKVPEDAHSRLHLRLDYGEPLWGELEVLCKFRSLRTLTFRFSEFTDIQVPLDLFPAVKCLRVLNLSCCSIDVLPDSIGCLKHLRYLDLGSTKIKCLPDSVCDLYKLQTLKLNGCDELHMLPSGISNLISLHYLEARHELVSKIAKVGKLTQLQSLEVFSVSEENGNKVGDLKDMNELRGKLCIRNLQRVVTREEAVEASLKEKQYLETLEMEWGDNRDVGQIEGHLEESIIEGLQTPPQLRELIVKCYAGINLPSWMNKSSISTLELVRVHRCINLNHLPRALVSLILRDIKVSALPSILHHLPLQQLVIWQLLELRELPWLPTTLRELTIYSVGLETLPEFSRGHGLSAATSGGCAEDEDSDGREPSLSILKIHGCPLLTTLDEGLLQHRLRHLRVLSIEDCEELVNWPEGEGFQSTLSSLEEELSISKCPKLKALPPGSKLSASLKKLTVEDCPGVTNESFYSQLHDLSSDHVYVERSCNVASCYDETLQHVQGVSYLGVVYFDAGTFSEAQACVAYDRERIWSCTLNGNYAHGRVALAVPDVAGDNGGSKLLSMCLGSHLWTSSLRTLSLSSIPDRATLGFQHMAPEKAELPSLERLAISSCRGLAWLRSCHLPALKELYIKGCPELTLSSLVEAIQSIPSLEDLQVYGCPNMATTSPPPLPRPPPLTLLRYLGIDSTRMLTQLLASNILHGPDQLPGSLRCLRIYDPVLTSLTEEEEVFRALAPSLQLLAFFDCPNLQDLHTDLKGLLPNLKILFLRNCPKIQCLPAGGLPSSLVLLRINHCPSLVRRCRPPSCGGGEDWHKMAHVPLLAIDQAFLRGSYTGVLEFQANVDFVFDEGC